MLSRAVINEVWQSLTRPLWYTHYHPRRLILPPRVSAPHFFRTRRRVPSSTAQFIAPHPPQHLFADLKSILPARSSCQLSSTLAPFCVNFLRFEMPDQPSRRAVNPAGRQCELSFIEPRHKPSICAPPRALTRLQKRCGKLGRRSHFAPAEAGLPTTCSSKTPRYRFSS